MINQQLDPLRDLSVIFAKTGSLNANSNGLIGNIITGNAVVNNANYGPQAFIGKVGVAVNFGLKTIGDNDGVITVNILASATNSISNATNVGILPVAGATVSNNAIGGAIIAVDTRAIAGPWLFYNVVITGTNSPAYPTSILAFGSGQVQ